MKAGRSKTGYDEWLGLIAERLRREDQAAPREQLPERWVDLIRHLNEEERKQSDAGEKTKPQQGDMQSAPRERSAAPGEKPT